KVASRRGGGATFTLTVILAGANGAHAEAADEALTALAIPPLRLLGVEDNPFGRVVLNTILGELGHQAEFIGRGEVAAERIAQGGFDAVLMDMVLPGIDGIETIRRIRALHAPFGRIAIIGVSGRAGGGAAQRARFPAQACVSTGSCGGSACSDSSCASCDLMIAALSSPPNTKIAAMKY